MATFSWEAPAAITSGISAQSIATAAGYVGSEIDNETNKDRFLSLALLVTPGTSPTEDYPIYVYIIYDQTSAQYEDGSSSVRPKKPAVMTFNTRASTSAQRITSLRIPIEPFAFQIVVWNECGQTCTVTVTGETYNEVVA